MSLNIKLGPDFYQRADVVKISRDLLGKVLCTKMDDAPQTAGIIVETEAYCGRNDKACHANDGLRTERTEVMYHPGGLAYVYLCYGIHHLFNVVTNVEDTADAILVRAIEPIQGIATIAKRRDKQEGDYALTNGPGKLTQALDIKTAMTGTSLLENKIWIEDRAVEVGNIVSSPRIGVDYAGEHAKRPWRFTIKDNKWVSHP